MELLEKIRRVGGREYAALLREPARIFALADNGKIDRKEANKIYYLMTRKKTTISVRVEQHIYEYLRNKAVKEKKNLSEIIRKIILEAMIRET